MRSNLPQSQLADALKQGTDPAKPGNHPVRTDSMMNLTRSLMACLCGCWLLSLLAQVSLAQPYPGPPPAYAGGLPWDQRQQYYEQLPSDRGIFSAEQQSPLDRFLRQAIRETWFKVEYLNWNLTPVKNDILGANVRNVPRPDLGFTINDVTTGAPSVNVDDVEQLSYAPRLGALDLAAKPGLRLTHGLNTNYGSLESSVMWLFNNTSSFEAGAPFPFQTTAPLRSPVDGVVAIPFMTGNGLPATEAIVVDRLGVTYDTSMFGVEINFVTDDFRPVNGFHFRPLVGFRYNRIEETMNLNGRVLATEDSPQQNTNYSSNALNQLFGPQVGARTELRDDFFTVGAQTAFTFGLTHINTRVVGNNPVNPFDASQVLENRNTNNVFSPLFSLQLFSEIRLREGVKLYGGYEWLYIGTISRAYKTITYDLAYNGGFIANKDNNHIFNHGFSVGLLFDF